MLSVMLRGREKRGAGSELNVTKCTPEMWTCIYPVISCSKLSAAIKLKGFTVVNFHLRAVLNIIPYSRII